MCALRKISPLPGSAAEKKLAILNRICDIELKAGIRTALRMQNRSRSIIPERSIVLQRIFPFRGKDRRPLNISRTIALVFALIIALGTLLLWLPAASRSGVSCGFLTALFTSASATCVTGLVLADTWSLWSGFGQGVLWCLIELGGLGFMSVASFFIFLLRRKVSMNQRFVIAQSVGAEDLSAAVRIQKRMLAVCLGTETAGALALTACFAPKYGFRQGLKLGVFHAVSAFCNAGFDILGFEAPGSSLVSCSDNIPLLLVLSLLIITGGIGFLVWDEIYRVREMKKWSVYTKLVLIATAALLSGGTVLYCLLEWNNPATLGGMPLAQKLANAFFQSVTVRTAGFAAVDQGALTEGGKAVSLLLMLIGGCSGSTAGGLKTVTFLVLVLFLHTRLRGGDNVHVFCRTVPQKQVMDAMTLFSAMIALSFFGGCIICTASPVSFTDALFEAVSALATVGLSTGITAELSLFAKLLLIVYMYFGRIGILTLSLGFFRTKDTGLYQYADTTLLIG